MKTEQYCLIINLNEKAIEVRALFSDLDGVIVDTEPLKFLSYVHALVSLGVPLSELENPDDSFYSYYTQNCVGGSRLGNVEKQFEWLKNKHLFPKGLTIKKYINKRLKHYESIQKNIEAPLISQNINCLKKFKSNHSFGKIFIVSRTPYQRTKEILKRAGLEGTTIIAVVPKKDSPKYCRAIRLANRLRQGEFKISLENIVAIEDTAKGVEEAKEYKLTTIAVPNSFTRYQDFSKADVTTDSLSDYIN